MNDRDRSPEVVLGEAAPMLALLATRGLYAEQPQLWKLGERGRSHTLEDFNHHFRALHSLSLPAFQRHVQYCEELFAARRFPRKWLDDAWRWMALVVERELPPEVAAPALKVLGEATGTPTPVRGSETEI